MKKKIGWGIGILALVVLLFGGTYAWLTYTINSSKNSVLKSGDLALSMTEGNAINLPVAVPVSDEDGLLSEPYTFTLENTGSIGSEYSIYLEDLSLENGETRVPDNKIKYSLKKGDTSIGTGLLSSTGQSPYRVLDRGTIEAKVKVTYQLWLWIDANAGIEIQDMVFKGKIKVEATQKNGATATDCFTFLNGAITAYNAKCGTDVVIPETINGEAVIGISANAFANKNLTSVVLPDGLQRINMFAFYNNNLTFVDIPASVTLTDQRSFASNKLTLIHMRPTTYIGAGAFTDNQLPDDQAFIYQNSGGSVDKTTLVSYGGAKRDKVVIPNNVKTINAMALMYNQIRDITIPTSVTMIEFGAFNDNQLPDDQAIIYKRNNDGSEDKTTIVSYGGANRNNVVIPEGVKTIREYAFMGSKISKITFASTITEINQGAFWANNLTEITIPPLLTNLSKNVFASNLLVHIVIPDNITTIESLAFDHIYGLQTVEVGKNVTEIQTNAFQKGYGYQLKKIINKTGRSFDWKSITGGNAVATFVTGTIPHLYGDIKVTAS